MVCSTPLLPRKLKRSGLAVDLHVAPLQRGQAVGLVLARVLVVADADQGLVEQAHHGGKQLAAAEVVGAQVALDALAQRRQHLAELEHAAELGAVARLAVRRVVAVLLAAARVARRRLDVAVGVGADPDVGPRRRDGERVETLADLARDDALAVGQVVGPAGAGALARDAAERVGDVPQAGLRRGLPVHQSARIPAVLMSCVHFSLSRATSASASRHRHAHRACAALLEHRQPSGCASTLSIAPQPRTLPPALRAKQPTQVSMSKSSSLGSRTVGTRGRGSAPAMTPCSFCRPRLDLRCLASPGIVEEQVDPARIRSW